jgi:hypothetical protein
MESNKIFEKLENLYKKDEKSKSFVLHLIRAYLPVDKCQKVFDIKAADAPKFKCALTNAKLISINEIFTGMQSEEFKSTFINDLKIQMDENGKQIPTSPAILKITNGRILGWQGKDTNTYLCQDAVQELYNWVATKMLQGDGKINWTIRSMQPKQPQRTNHKSESTYVKQTVKPATASLGDNDALQALKAKFDSQKNPK